MDFVDKIIAIVAIKDSTPINPAAVAQRVREMFPWMAKSVGAPPLAEGQSDTCIIPMGDAIVPIIQVHFPIPPETLARPIGMNWFWPQAKKAFDAAHAHVIVSALTPTNDPQLARDNAVRVTCVTAALAQMLPATGIYWVTAGNVLAPDRFVAETMEAGENGTPFDLWVATHFYPGPDFVRDNRIIASTTGLRAFIGREIECGPSPKEPSVIGPIVRGVGHYVLDGRVEFAGGETIGTQEDPIGQIVLDRTLIGTDSNAVYRVVLAEDGDE